LTAASGVVGFLTAPLRPSLTRAVFNDCPERKNFNEGKNVVCSGSFLCRTGPGQSLEQFLTIGYGAFFGAHQFIDHVTALSASLDGSWSKT